MWSHWLFILVLRMTWGEVARGLKWVAILGFQGCAQTFFLWRRPRTCPTIWNSENNFSLLFYIYNRVKSFLLKRLGFLLRYLFFIHPMIGNINNIEYINIARRPKGFLVESKEFSKGFFFLSLSLVLKGISLRWTELKSWIFQASLRNCSNCVHDCEGQSFTWLSTL